MKDEIKEILEALKPHNDIVKEYPLILSIEEQKLLSDYITNLQEENQKFKNWINVLNKDNHNYKSRNDKAKSLTNRTIEIIKQQPSGNDEWILERLNGINYCLGGDEE